jgi:hypothetical protein
MAPTGNRAHWRARRNPPAVIASPEYRPSPGLHGAGREPRSSRRPNPDRVTKTPVARYGAGRVQNLQRGYGRRNRFTNSRR